MDEGLAFEQIERQLELQHRNAFSIMELKFWRDCRLRLSRGIQENTGKFWFPSFSNHVLPHPSDDLLIDLYVAGFKLQEDCFAQAMSRLPARWMSCDHTFKSVANIGYKRPRDGKWIKLYNSAFCILNEKAEVLQWQFTRSENFHEISAMFSNLRRRLQYQNTLLELIIIDNCCKWKEGLNRLFPGTPIKLDLFHAVQRFVKTLSKQNPYHRAVSRDYGLIFRDPKDLEERRTMPTPEPSLILHNLDQFLGKWKDFTHEGKQIITGKGEKALKNVKNHILKGCLSNIPVGCCTSAQERLHREMKKILTSNRMGSELAYSKFSRFFFQSNAKKSGKAWSPIMEEVSKVKGNAMQSSSEVKPTYIETFGIRHKAPAQSGQERQCSEEVPTKNPLVAVTCAQINIILDEIKLEINDNCESSDFQEDNNHTYDSVSLPQSDKSAEQILQMLQYGLSLFKVMLVLQKSQEMKSFSFSKLPFMSRVLLHARSLIETSERRSRTIKCTIKCKWDRHQGLQ